MTIEVPCKNCEERHAECHARCELYSQFKNAKKEQNDIEYKRRMLSYDHRYIRVAKSTNYLKRRRT